MGKRTLDSCTVCSLRLEIRNLLALFWKIGASVRHSSRSTFGRLTVIFYAFFAKIVKPRRVIKIKIKNERMAFEGELRQKFEQAKINALLGKKLK